MDYGYVYIMYEDIYEDWKDQSIDFTSSNT